MNESFLCDNCTEVRNIRIWKQNIITAWVMGGLLSHLNSNSFMNQDERKAEFIKINLGETYIALETLLPLTFIYSLFFVVGILGNLATCIVVISNEYMRLVGAVTFYKLFRLQQVNYYWFLVVAIWFLIQLTQK